MHPTPGTVFEVRVRVPNGKPAPKDTDIWRAWYRHEDIDRAAAELAAFDAGHEPQPRGCYCTINPCKPELLKRGSRLSHGPATHDGEVAARRLLVIDFSPSRAEGHAKDSATGAEKEAALQVLMAVREYLTGRGWPGKNQECGA